MSTCINCGLPEHSLSQEGQTIQIQLKAGYGEKRPRRSTVWVCTEECALQAMCISRYGENTAKWPITMAQGRVIMRKELAKNG